MKIPNGRLHTFTLIPLLTFIGFAAHAGAQVHNSTMLHDVNAETLQHRQALAGGVRVRPDGSVTTHNWSGYVVTGATGSVTDIKGSWTVPAVSCASSNTYSAFWVGIDGYNLSDLEQIGTDSYCENGKPVYSAWYEFLPQEQTEQLIRYLDVQPGDVISAEVSFNPSSGLFTVSIADKQANGRTEVYSKSEAVEGASRSSAEWIAEAPSIGDCVEPLANFGTVDFTQDMATLAGQTGPIGSFTSNAAITMKGDGENCTQTGIVEAFPSPLASNESSFSVTFGDLEMLYSFTGGSGDGGAPYAGLIFGTGGRLYGANSGGVGSCGIVFELTPMHGGWTETTLHNFSCAVGSDGQFPKAGLIFDRAGNLYGTTYYGGVNGYGTVFELLPSEGNWTEAILHSFTGSDGSNPSAGLIFDRAGSLYGTTGGGGAGGAGTVFKLTPSGGAWTETVLHSFTGGDGSSPVAGLIFDSTGNLYGTTPGGGADGSGTVFELKPSQRGWMESVLHSFAGSFTDGSGPAAGLILDGAGNLYGTTTEGGPAGGGTVFELTPSNGAWAEAILHGFAGSDGNQPEASLVFDSGGNLYSTTLSGGLNGDGVVFELTPAGSVWTETVLHSFAGTDGELPVAGLILDSAGNLYGTTLLGAAYGDGAVFEIVP